MKLINVLETCKLAGDSFIDALDYARRKLGHIETAQARRIWRGLPS